jgi:hypothetical protein
MTIFKYHFEGWLNVITLRIERSPFGNVPIFENHNHEISHHVERSLIGMRQVDI